MGSEVFKIVISHLPFVISHLSYKLLYEGFYDKSFKGAKCVSITIVSCNINEVTRAILNSFIQILHNHKKKHKTLTSEQKQKNAPKKHLRGKQSLIRLFAFLCFCPSVFVLFSAFGAFLCFQCFWCLWCVQNLCVKKKQRV